MRSCCGEQSKVLIERCTDLLHGCPGEWSLVECAGCGLVSIEPMPTEDQIAALYPADYGPYRSRRPLGKTAAGAFLRRLAMLPYTWRFGPAIRIDPPAGVGRM